MTRPGHRDRENKYEQTSNNRRAPIILTAEDIAQGKESYWSELEITGMYYFVDIKIIKLGFNFFFVFISFKVLYVILVHNYGHLHI